MTWAKLALAVFSLINWLLGRRDKAETETDFGQDVEAEIERRARAARGVADDIIMHADVGPRDPNRRD